MSATKLRMWLDFKVEKIDTEGPILKKKVEMKDVRALKLHQR